MSKAELMEVTEALVQQLQDRGIEDRVNISLVKEAGSYSCKRHLDASSPAAAMASAGAVFLRHRQILRTARQSSTANRILLPACPSLTALGM